MAATFKVATLLIKALIKPIASEMKRAAVNEGLLRSTCHQVGQFSNVIMTHIQLRSLGHKVKKVKPLPADDAVKAGADLVAEAMVLGFGLLAIGAEVIRKSKADAIASHKAELAAIEDKKRKELRQLERETQLRNQLRSLEERMIDVENAKLLTLHDKLLKEQLKHLAVTENLLKRIQYLEHQLNIVSQYPLTSLHFDSINNHTNTSTTANTSTDTGTTTTTTTTTSSSLLPVVPQQQQPSMLTHDVLRRATQQLFDIGVPTATISASASSKLLQPSYTQPSPHPALVLPVSSSSSSVAPSGNNKQTTTAKNPTAVDLCHDDVDALEANVIHCLVSADIPQQLGLVVKHKDKNTSTTHNHDHDNTNDVHHTNQQQSSDISLSTQTASSSSPPPSVCPAPIVLTSEGGHSDIASTDHSSIRQWDPIEDQHSPALCGKDHLVVHV